MKLCQFSVKQTFQWFYHKSKTRNKQYTPGHVFFPHCSDTSASDYVFKGVNE